MRYNVLLIDDEIADLFLHRAVLEDDERIGDIKDFRRAEEALNYLKRTEQTTHLIFLDINMPGMDGFGFLHAYSELGGEAGAARIVVMLTSSMRREDRVRATSYKEVAAYMEKPLLLQGLDEVLAEL